MKKILVMLLLVGSIFGKNKDYKSIILSDNEGNIVYEENGNYIHPLASITKLMSAVVTLEAIENKEVSLEDMVPISRDAALRGGSRIELYWGSSVKLEDLLEASLIHSANNATYAIAEYVGGDYESFVNRMNKKAHELGMNNTKFYTPAGLPTDMTGKGMDKGSTRDIVKLSIYALKNEKLKEIVAKKSTVINNSKEDLTIYNRNKLLRKVEGVDGLKTGHHEEAGYNISISFDYEDKDYVAVIFGSPSEEVRDKNMKYLLDEVYTNGLAKLKEENVKNIITMKNSDIKEKSIKIEKKDDMLIVETEGIVGEDSLGQEENEFEIAKEDLKELIENELTSGGEEESTLIRTEELIDENGNVIEKEIIYSTGKKGEIEELEEQFEEEVELIVEDNNSQDKELEAIKTEVELTSDSAVDIIVDEILEEEVVEVEVKIVSENLDKKPVEKKYEEIPVVIIKDPIDIGENKRVFVNEEVSIRILD